MVFANRVSRVYLEMLENAELTGREVKRSRDDGLNGHSIA